MKKVSIVIPAKDEEQTIGLVLDELNKTINRLKSKYIFEVIVVDDHCRDKTASIASGKRAVVMKNKKAPGKGNALQTGFGKANGDYLVMMDADYSHRAEDLPQFLTALDKGAGLVVGSRIFGGSEEYTRVRALGNILLTLAFGLFHGRYLSDALNGYKAFQRDIFSDFNYQSSEFEIEIELLVNTLRKKKEIVEVSSHERKRAGGLAKSRVIKHGLKFFLRIIKEWRKRKLEFKQEPRLLNEEVENEWLTRMNKLNKYNEWLFSKIKPYIGDSILEVGAGIGTYSQYLLKAKLLVLSDIEEKYLVNLKKNFENSKNVYCEKIDLVNNNDITKLAKYKIDTVISINVFEHIKSDQKALENIYKIIQPGGRLLTVIPNHPFLYGSLDKYAHHFRRYSMREAVNLLTKAGFKVEKKFTFNFLGAINWFLQGRIFKKTIVSAGSLDWAEKVVILSKIIDNINPFPIGANIVLIAKK